MSMNIFSKDKFHKNYINSSSIHHADEDWPLDLTKLYSLGDFICLNGHCCNRDMRELCENLGICKVDAENLTTICLSEGCAKAIVSYFEQDLTNLDEFCWRGRLNVNIVIETQPKSIIISSETIPAIGHSLSVCINPMYYQRNYVVCGSSPVRTSKLLLDADMYRHVPSIQRLVKQPHPQPDGSINIEQKYGQGEELFSLHVPFNYFRSEDPSWQDIEYALAIINHYLFEFSDKTEYDPSAHGSCVLLANMHPSLSSTPLNSASVIGDERPNLFSQCLCHRTDSIDH